MPIDIPLFPAIIFPRALVPRLLRVTLGELGNIFLGFIETTRRAWTCVTTYHGRLCQRRGRRVFLVFIRLSFVSVIDDGVLDDVEEAVRRLCERDHDALEV